MNKELLKSGYVTIVVTTFKNEKNVEETLEQEIFSKSIFQKVESLGWEVFSKEELLSSYSSFLDKDVMRFIREEQEESLFVIFGIFNDEEVTGVKLPDITALWQNKTRQISSQATDLWPIVEQIKRASNPMLM
jgi:hypothetical protein